MSSKNIIRTIKEKIKFKRSSTCIDNWAFKVHYRLTVAIFFTASVLVTSREYIGEHIRCMTDSNNRRFERVVETFCFFSTTFTVVPRYDMEKFGFPFFIYPGVMPYHVAFRKYVKNHVYYQWVPFLLFGQGIMFYLTRMLWKSVERGRIHNLTCGLEHPSFSFLEKELKIGNRNILSLDQRNSQINKIKTNLLECSFLNKPWVGWFIFFELMNFLHTIFQIYITNRFLGNQFCYLGLNFFKRGSKSLDEVFPKVTKCTFHQYGRSGTIEEHDALCVMALNVINEKIYLFLWFWFLILLTTSLSILIWRLLTLIFYKKCRILNQILFGFATQWKLSPSHLNIILEDCSYSDWLFLRYLGKNMDCLAFKRLLDDIFEEYWSEVKNIER